MRDAVSKGRKKMWLIRKRTKEVNFWPPHTYAHMCTHNNWRKPAYAWPSKAWLWTDKETYRSKACSPCHSTGHQALKGSYCNRALRLPLPWFFMALNSKVSLVRPSLTLSTPRTIPLSPPHSPNFYLSIMLANWDSLIKRKELSGLIVQPTLPLLLCPYGKKSLPVEQESQQKLEEEVEVPLGHSLSGQATSHKVPFLSFHNLKSTTLGDQALGPWRVLRIPAIASCVLALVEPGSAERPAYAVILRQTRLNSSFCQCAFLSIKENNKISKKTKLFKHNIYMCVFYVWSMCVHIAYDIMQTVQANVLSEGAREMAQRSRAHTALAEDPRLIPSTHIG